MNKRKIFLLFFVFLLLISLVSSQNSGDLQENLEETREQIDEIKYNFLGEKWKEIFLKNSFVSNLDNFFNNVNFLFIALFARDWSLSFDMFFVFLMWLFTLLSLQNYLVWFKWLFFLKENWQVNLGALAFTIMLAHIQLFNSLSVVARKIILYRSSMVWAVASTIIIIMAAFFYLLINRYFGNKIKKIKEEQEKSELKTQVKANKEFIEEVGKATRK